MKCKELYFGCRVKQVEEIEDINGTGYVLEHEKSGANILYLKTEDENKTFAIGFKTIPEDSTGVFHILEHSVLNGSKKYPVKEPFVELLKGSMQNFLNAFTFPDKTVYPFATTNEKDFMNLMSVYMDAVTNPLIYEKEDIFLQEGWHYELDEKGNLCYNGVVYNEMKGALSSIDTLLMNCTNEALFPDTNYRFVSGGHPDEITKLTYEKFLETHKKFYGLDNSYILLYGDLNIEEALKFLDEKYLSKASRENKSIEFTWQQPVANMDKYCVHYTEEEETGTCQISLSYVVGSYKEREQNLALKILMEVLMGSNESILKKKLLDANLGEDAFGFVRDGVLQPVVVFQLRNATKEKKDRFVSIVEETLSQLKEEGIPKERLHAIINQLEFSLREKNFGMPEGIVYSLNALEGWLYGEEVLDFLKNNKLLKKMRDSICTNYFEQVMERALINNNHKAVVVLETKKKEENAMSKEEETLLALEQTLTRKEKEQIKEKAEKLLESQMEKNTKEQLDTLPKLTIEDVVGKKKVSHLTVFPSSENNNRITYLYHNVFTNQISYVYYYFDFSQVEQWKLPYITLLTELFSGLDTEKYTASQLENEIQMKLGYVQFFTEVQEITDKEAIHKKLVVGSSCLPEYINDVVTIPMEISNRTRFEKKEEIKKILLQVKAYMERKFLTSGHSVATTRVQSYATCVGAIREDMEGISFYQFLCQLLKDFDEKFQEIKQILEGLVEEMISHVPVTISFTGSEKEFEQFKKCVEETDYFVPKKVTKELENSTLKKEEDTKEVYNAATYVKEGFVIPSEVSYVAKTDSLKRMGMDYNGHIFVLSRILTLDYFWNEVRVKGGAYGSGLQIGRTGNVVFYSYRDPRQIGTINTFYEVEQYIKELDLSEDEMTKYIIGALAMLEQPKKPSEIGRYEDNCYFTNWSLEDVERIKKEITTTTVSDIKKCAVIFEKMKETNYACIIGNGTQMEKERVAFEEIRPLIQKY